jgi:hypothetical protein
MQSCGGHAVPPNRNRLKLKIFRLFEGEAEGQFAITALVVIVLLISIVLSRL